jgi:phage anti-repressor protein
MNKFKDFISKIISIQDEKFDEKFVKEFLFSLESEEKFCIPAEKLLEWKVFTFMRDVKRKLKNIKCKDGEEFTRKFVKSTGGRPAEKIMLTVDCFKHLCMVSKNPAGDKVRTYYLVLEKLFKKYTEEEFKRQLEDKNNQIDKLETDLTDEQKEVIKVKKSLMGIQSKFCHRYKFPVMGCVYILKDPDCKYGKYKIGLTTDINNRLKSDRTMIPDIQVCSIFYTRYYELFEKIIKVKYIESLEMPSHEWVFESLEDLIAGYKEIDKVCGFNSIIEKNLWRYNLEDPPEKLLVVPKSKPIISKPIKKKEAKNIPKFLNKLDERLSGILPTRLLQCDYKIKTSEAPQGQRWCNGYCQTYQPVTSFTMNNTYPRTICIFCEHMVDIAQIKIESGILTPKQISENPTLLKIRDNERLCKTCMKVLLKTSFTAGRRQCKTCRNSVRSKLGDKFDDFIDVEIEELKSFSEYDMIKKVNTYVKTELHKIMTMVGVGRKYNDNKQECVQKLIFYFTK